MIGDLPEADSAPPTNMLFVCKLNPVRQGLGFTARFLSAAHCPVGQTAGSCCRLQLSIQSATAKRCCHQALQPAPSCCSLCS